ncbi:hypothetical protein BOH78_2236 [Pichia kudriavzevii]|uniref:FHA domain-containing protein n=1 Tax=Pichia kudriavzevii TaxID=4909 RepID=A0A1V2LNY7_PICKU|nr:hypothetical protein BOH78_2236 [Pichia kudriavzevii]
MGRKVAKKIPPTFKYLGFEEVGYLSVGRASSKDQTRSLNSKGGIYMFHPNVSASHLRFHYNFDSSTFILENLSKYVVFACKDKTVIPCAPKKRILTNNGDTIAITFHREIIDNWRSMVYDEFLKKCEIRIQVFGDFSKEIYAFINYNLPKREISNEVEMFDYVCESTPKALLPHDTRETSTKILAIISDKEKYVIDETTEEENDVYEAEEQNGDRTKHKDQKEGEEKEDRFEETRYDEDEDFFYWKTLSDEEVLSDSISAASTIELAENYADNLDLIAFDVCSSNEIELGGQTFGKRTFDKIDYADDEDDNRLKALEMKLEEKEREIKKLKGNTPCSRTIKPFLAGALTATVATVSALYHIGSRMT